MIFVAAQSPKDAAGAMAALGSVIKCEIPYTYLSRISQLKKVNIATVVVLNSFYKRKSLKLEKDITNYCLNELTYNTSITFIPGAEYATIQFRSFHSRKDSPAPIRPIRANA